MKVQNEIKQKIYKKKKTEIKTKFKHNFSKSPKKMEGKYSSN